MSDDAMQAKVRLTDVLGPDLRGIDACVLSEWLRFKQQGVISGNEVLLQAKDVCAAARPLIDSAVAAERERLYQVVRAFPHWLGPQAKRELLTAMGCGPNVEANGRRSAA